MSDDNMTYVHPCPVHITPKGVFPPVICNLPYIVRWRGSTPKRDPHTCRTLEETK